MRRLVFLIVLGIIINGCKKEDLISSDTSANVLIYNSVIHQTPKGMLIFKELADENLCLYDLKIYSSNFTFNSSTGEATSVDGTGKIITFYLISSIELTDVNNDRLVNDKDIILDNLVLDEGQYLFSSEWIEKTFEADFTVEATMADNVDVHSFKSGSLDITVSRNVYEITYTGLDENNLNITGYFKGKLDVIRNQ